MHNEEVVPKYRDMVTNYGGIEKLLTPINKQKIQAAADKFFDLLENPDFSIASDEMEIAMSIVNKIKIITKEGTIFCKLPEALLVLEEVKILGKVIAVENPELRSELEMFIAQRARDIILKSELPLQCRNHANPSSLETRPKINFHLSL